MTLVSLVVPVYHNAPSLPDLLAAFQALAARNPHDDFVFVDDGLRKTIEYYREHKAEYWSS